MVARDLLAFVRANLPAPPLRLLEVGAGDGELARALAAAGYEVLAIDPEPRGADVRTVALHELDEPTASFNAALAVTSLHHVEPVEDSLARLADVLEPGGVLVIGRTSGGCGSDERSERKNTPAQRSSSASIARTCTLSSESSQRSSRTSRSRRRSTVPTSTAGTSTSRCGPTKKTR